MDKYSEHKRAEECLSAHLHPLLASCNMKNKIENSSHVKPFGVVEFY